MPYSRHVPPGKGLKRENKNICNTNMGKYGFQKTELFWNEKKIFQMRMAVVVAIGRLSNPVCLIFDIGRSINNGLEQHDTVYKVEFMLEKNINDEERVKKLIKNITKVIQIDSEKMGRVLLTISFKKL